MHTHKHTQEKNYEATEQTDPHPPTHPHAKNSGTESAPMGAQALASPFPGTRDQYLNSSSNTDRLL